MPALRPNYNNEFNISIYELLIWFPYMAIIYTYSSITTYAHMSQADATDKIFYACCHN